eukprot:SAG22_NODE_175_length_16235_cov_67.112729_11_plen_205_part_00
MHGNYYGTSFGAIHAVGDAGKICILDIDVQGWCGQPGRQQHLPFLVVLRCIPRLPACLPACLPAVPCGWCSSACLSRRFLPPAARAHRQLSALRHVLAACLPACLPQRQRLQEVDRPAAANLPLHPAPRGRRRQAEGHAGCPADRCVRCCAHAPQCTAVRQPCPARPPHILPLRKETTKHKLTTNERACSLAPAQAAGRRRRSR